MKANGRMIRLMEWVIISMQMVLHITESGKTTNNTEKGQRPGQMERGTKAHILKEKNMEKEFYSLQMGVSIMEISNTTKYQGKANMYGLIRRHMMVSGKRIKCMAMVY